METLTCANSIDLRSEQVRSGAHVRTIGVSGPEKGAE